MFDTNHSKIQTGNIQQITQEKKKKSVHIDSDKKKKKKSQETLTKVLKPLA